MASLILGVAGAVIGSSFGYAGLGYTIGSSLGSMFGGSRTIKQEGPRLGDLRVQASIYGVSIPKVYGGIRLSGNMIWSTPILETRHSTTQRSGGKGGGGQKVKTITYTYSQSFAVAICEGEIAGIRKIWANGELIYNLGTDATKATIVASNAVASGMSIYTGSESQTANSLIQANVGAANCPAYKGVAYVVFNNLQLAKYGNKAPNLEFEVVDSFAFQHPVGELVSYSTTAGPHDICFDPITNSVWAVNYTGGNLGTVDKFNTTTGARTTYNVLKGPAGVCFDSASESIWVGNYNDQAVSKINIHTGIRTDFTTLIPGTATNYPGKMAFDPVTRSVWVCCPTLGQGYICRFDVFTGARTVLLPSGSPESMCFDSLTKSMWVTTGANTLLKYEVWSGGIIGTYATNITPHRMAFDSITGSIWVNNFSAGMVSKFDVYTGARVDYPVAYNTSHGICFDPNTQSIWVAYHTEAKIGKINIYTQVEVVYDHQPNSYLYSLCYDPGTYSVWSADLAIGKVTQINTIDWGMSAPGALLSNIITDICEGAGLSAGDLDVSDLMVDNVQGYLVQRASARNQIEPLLIAYFVDAVESDGLIRFVARGGASIIAITEGDLSAYESGESPEPLMRERTQEMELPVEVSVSYLDIDAGYQTGTQVASRSTVASVNKDSVELAIAMQGTKAKQVADVLLFDQWMQRTRAVFSTGFKYSWLNPSDIITVTVAGRSYVLRITKESFNGGVFLREGALDNSSVYTQTETAGDLLGSGGVVNGVPLTRLELMDIPLLLDQDDQIGFYAAACGRGPSWRGAQVFKSIDDEASWFEFGNGFTSSAVIGQATSALGNWAQNIFDEGNSVTITLENGAGDAELSSTTEAAVINGANSALLGNEIIQFKNAALIATDTYTLTGLLRGRQGTEWACSSHLIGDRFILLDRLSVYLFDGPSNEYGVPRNYRPVTFDGYIEDTITKVFTHGAVARKPYAPVHLGGGRDGSGNLTLNWIRRSRLGGGWTNLSEIPVGEDTEAYEVEIYSSSAYTTLKRTITGLTSPTTLYSAANQTTDFGSPQATVYFIVYQLSAVIGRGYGARGVI